MIPGPPAVCEGTVVHRRAETTAHEFTYPVSQVWFDPDRPDDLCDLHPAWSARRPSPVRFRRQDYGGSDSGSLAEEARHDLGAVLGRPVDGPVRMLTQLRRWGWLFNPISLFLVWHTDPESPVGAVAEVSNTPWKERTHYPVPLERVADGRWETTFDKSLHVSPFLHEDYRYRLTVSDLDPTLEVGINVLAADDDVPIVETALRVMRLEASKAAMTRALTRGALSTRIVSFAIHAQAVKLTLKRVPIVAHPRKRTVESPDGVS
ncbi:MAG: DUF1365 domain-containing protein [Acidimicrobiales bacterium]|nr:DUF1365 domain-containing protein [Acidimicrobiales bacterium]